MAPVQNIPTIPDDVKAIYKTVWEISQKKVLDLAADRGAFICQSQSLNVHLQAPTLGQLTSMHFYGWKEGPQDGMYYLRTRPAAQAIQFTVDQSVLASAKAQNAAASRSLGARPVARGGGIPTPSQSPSPRARSRRRPHLRLQCPSRSSRSLYRSSCLHRHPSPHLHHPSLHRQARSRRRRRARQCQRTRQFLRPRQVLPYSWPRWPLTNVRARRRRRIPTSQRRCFASMRASWRTPKLQCSLENKEACLMCSG